MRAYSGLLLCLLCVVQISATPLLYPRQIDAGSSSSSGVGASVWVPIAVVFGILVAASMFGTLYKRYKARQLARLRAASNAQTATVAGRQPTSLTAAQLAPEATALTGSQRRPRRNRRPRRTPSQISTRSLPQYMENPGEQELVLVRRREEIMEEDDEESGSGHRRADSTMHSEDEDGSEEDARPVSSTPLLESHPDQNAPDGSGSAAAPLVDPRGEAPAYIEVEEANDTVPDQLRPAVQSNNSSAPEVSGTSANSASPATTPAPRRSTLRRLFGPLTPSAFTAPPTRSFFGSSPSQQESVPLVTTSSNAPGSPPTQQRAIPRHRSSVSIGDARSLTSSNDHHHSSPLAHMLSRVRSRSSAVENPMSSTISLISAPIPTSVTRTDFQYPSAGPTAEQIAFVSSTQSLIRFGVPYGEAAQEPPPAFNFGSPSRHGRGESLTVPPVAVGGRRSTDTSRTSLSHQEGTNTESPAQSTTQVTLEPVITIDTSTPSPDVSISLARTLSRSTTKSSKEDGELTAPKTDTLTTTIVTESPVTLSTPSSTAPPSIMAGSTASSINETSAVSTPPSSIYSNDEEVRPRKGRDSSSTSNTFLTAETSLANKQKNGEDNHQNTNESDSDVEADKLQDDANVMTPISSSSRPRNDLTNQTLPEPVRDWTPPHLDVVPPTPVR